MDCLEGMKRIPDGSVDLVVTSPPYDNLRTYNNDVDKTWGEHVWKPIIKELYRVIADGGYVVWNVNDATLNGSETGTSFRQALYFMECGFNLHDTMIWEKTCNGCLGSNKCYLQNFEYMFVFSKGNPTKFNPIEDRKNVVKAGKVGMVNSQLKDGKGTDRQIVRKEYGRRTNIWQINQQQNSDHPAPFPDHLAESHVISWTNEGDVVLDPFMGSATTAVACHKYKRHFIGFELNKEYYDKACKRIKAEQAQLTLF
jgi:site-specific DNA-methyltransferase (adenine-specific)